MLSVGLPMLWVAMSRTWPLLCRPPLAAPRPTLLGCRSPALRHEPGSVCCSYCIETRCQYSAALAQKYSLAPHRLSRFQYRSMSFLVLVLGLLLTTGSSMSTSRSGMETTPRASTPEGQRDNDTMGSAFQGPIRLGPTPAVITDSPYLPDLERDSASGSEHIVTA